MIKIICKKVRIYHIRISNTVYNTDAFPAFHRGALEGFSQLSRSGVAQQVVKDGDGFLVAREARGGRWQQAEDLQMGDVCRKYQRLRLA